MNLLFVLHNWVGYAPHGGTEVHVQALVETLIENTSHKIYVLFPDLRAVGDCNNYLLVNPRNNFEKKIILNYPVSQEYYRHQELTDKFSPLIVEHGIDVVHFFHLIKYPLNLPLVAKMAGAKTVVSFFDYYFICPQFNFLKKDNYFCEYPNVSLSSCDLCLKQLFNYKANTQQRRRLLISEVLYHTDAVHYLCNDQRSRMIAAYPHLKDKIAITMGLGFDNKPKIDSKYNNYSLPLKIACVGNFDTNKGAVLLLQVIDYYQCIKQSDIEFHIYGDVRHPYSTVLNEMAKYKTVKLHGSYTPNQLPKLLRQCHIAVFASIWPETFVLALSEAWSCGLIPVAPKIGAFGERIMHGKNGFLYDYKDPGSLITILDNFLTFKNQDFLDLLEGINQVEYPSLQSNLKEYILLYQCIQQRSVNLDSIELLSRLIVEVHPEVWHSISQVPSSQLLLYSSKNQVLRKGWQFYKREGLRSTICRLANYAKSKINRV